MGGNNEDCDGSRARPSERSRQLSERARDDGWRGNTEDGGGILSDALVAVFKGEEKAEMW